MAFDITTARQHYSDDEIADFLASKRGIDIEAARAAGWTTPDLLAEMSSEWAKQPLPKGVSAGNRGLAAAIDPRRTDFGPGQRRGTMRTGAAPYVAPDPLITDDPLSNPAPVEMRQPLIEQRGAPVRPEVAEAARAQLAALPREQRIAQGQRTDIPAWMRSTVQAANRDISAADGLNPALGVQAPSLEARTARAMSQGADAPTARAAALGSALAGRPLNLPGARSLTADEIAVADARKQGEAVAGDNPIRAGLYSAGQGVQQGGAGVAAMVLQAFGDEKGAKEFEQAGKVAKARADGAAELQQMKRRAAELGLAPQGLTDALGADGAAVVGVANSFGQMLPAMAAGAGTLAISKNPAAAVNVASGIMGTQVAGQEYIAGREKGLNPGHAALRAATMGATEVLFERFGLTPKIIGAFRNAAADVPTAELPQKAAAFLKALSNRGVATMAKEVASENATTVTQYLVDGSPLGLNQPISVGELLEQMRDTTVQTMMLTGMMMAPGAVMNAGQRRDAQADPQPQPPATAPQQVIPPQQVVPPQAGAQPQAAQAVDNIVGALRQAGALPQDAIPAADLVDGQDFTGLDAAATQASPAQPGASLDRLRDSPLSRNPRDEVLPVGDATEIDPIPVGQATEMIPTADATELEAIPTGDATEIAPEVIQADDIMASDGEPFTSRTSAAAKAYSNGGGEVVRIPNHFGDGKPGFVVRPIVEARPTGTRGTDARDIAQRVQPAAAPDMAADTNRGANDGQGQEGRRQEVLTAPAATMPPDQTLQPVQGGANEVAAPTNNDRPMAAGQPVATDKPKKTKIYKNRGVADAARKAAGNTVKVQKIKGGYILRPKTDAEIEAEAKNAKRLTARKTIDVQRDPLLVAIAKNGGLAPTEKADTIGEGNKLTRGGHVFRATGLPIDTMAEYLAEDGYIPPQEMERDGGTTWLRDAIKAEYMGSREHFSQRGEGWLEDRMAEAERQAQMDAEGDPFGPLSELTPDDLDLSGYTQASPEVQQATEELLAAAEALGIDRETLVDDAARATADQPEDAYHAEVQRLAREAIAAAGRNAQGPDAATAPGSNQDRGEADGGQEQGAGQGLTLEAQTAEDLRAKAEREQAAAEAERAEQRRLAAQAAAETRRKNKAEEDARAAQVRKERADAAVDNFELGQEAPSSVVTTAQAAGQQDVFADAPAGDTTAERVDAKPLYVSRSLTQASADAIRNWAASQGFKTTLPANDLHVTVAYSRDPVQWDKAGSAPESLTVRGGKRSVEPLGDQGAVVLKFDSQELQARWRQYRDAGASWDYETYTPHVTITYDGGGVDLANVQPYDGPIELEREQQESLNVDKADDYKAAGEAAVPATQAADEPARITESEARARFEWRNLGQRDNTTTHGLYFDGMQYGRVTLFKGDSRFQIDDGEPQLTLKKAKAEAERVAVGKLVRDGYVIDPAAAQTEQPAPRSASTDAQAAPQAFDSEAFDRERAQRIKQSRDAGNTHLDQVPAYVETMRGRDVYSVHDTKVRGRILTVDTNGNVFVEWLDKYSQDKEGATPMRMGRREVMQSSLGPRDLKDYVLRQPVTDQPQDQPGTTGVGAGASRPVPAAQQQDRRRAAAEAVRQAKVLKTNANSAMVWQIIGPDGEAMDGPPGVYPGREGPLAGSLTMGQRGWKTKREADAALAALKARADEILGAPQQQAPAEAVATPQPEPAALENFGEQLPPARRNMAAKLSEDLSDGDIAGKPLSEIWPQSENDAIEDTYAAAVAHAARAEIPAKPRVAYKLKSWVQKVQMLRSLAGKIVGGTVTRERFERDIVPDDARFSSLRDWYAKVLLLEQVSRDQWKRIGEVMERPDAYTYVDGKEVPAPMVRVEVDGKTHWLRGDTGVEGKARGTLNGNRAGIMALLGTDAPQQRLKFEIRRSTRTGVVFINKEGDPQRRKLMEFADVAEARKAMAEKYDALVAAWEAVKARDNITERDLRSAENRPRVGRDHRQGRDATPQEFQDTFGFRGGEFGKWVQQGKGDKERQAILNDAFDALMDLSDLLGIPPRAISLNGTLGIAFGSRGSGSASAHFEPSNLVINLTKTRGAGALGHEWFHALDNYFSRMRRGGKEAPFSGNQRDYRDENYITHRPEPLMIHKTQRSTPITRGRLEGLHAANPKSGYYNPENWQPDPKHLLGVRPEVEERFAALVSALDKSPMSERARTLDGIKESGDGYWSRTLERAARAFENYLQGKMQDQGYHNDFLANVVAAEDTGRNPDRYPYLLPDEQKPIREAFDALFATIQTRADQETGNVAMFSRATGAGLPLADAQASVAAIREAMPSAPPIDVHATLEDAPAELQGIIRRAGAANDVEGVYWQGRIHVFPQHIASRERLEFVVGHHEVRHHGLAALLGDERVPLMRRLYATNKAVREAADAYLKANPFSDRATAVEEALADMPVERVQSLRGWQRIVAAIRDGLRRFAETIRPKLPGLAAAIEPAEWTDADITALVRRAEDMSRAPAQQSATDMEPAPLFSRRPRRDDAANRERIGWNVPESSKFDDFVFKFQDKNIDLRRAIAAITAERESLEDRWDAYLQEELFHGRAAKRTQDFVNKELQPLLRDMTLRKVTMERLDLFLHARHAEEANKLIAERNKREDEGQLDLDGNVIVSPLQDGGSGMLTADARALLSGKPVTIEGQQVEGFSPEERSRLEAIAKRVDDIIATTRNTYVGYGLESKATVDGWASMFKHYVPLMREDHDGGMGIGQGFSIKGREAKSRTGSTAKVVDILANIAMQRERAIVRGEKNRVAVALAGLAKLNPQPDLWTFDTVPTERVYDEASGTVVERQVLGFKSKPNVLVAKIPDSKGNVQERAIVFNERNPRAVRMAASLKNLDAAQLEGLLGAVAKVTRYFASINTQYNPIFGIVNLSRDLSGSAINLTNTPLAGKRAAVISKVPAAWAGIYKDVRKSRKGAETDTEWARLWEDFQKEGGQTAFRDMFRTSEDRANAIRDAMDPTRWMDSPWGKVVTAGGALKMPIKYVAQPAATAVFNWLEDYNLTMENAVRLAAYKVALEDGMTKQRAASLAKNLTVNFNRRGQVGTQVGALYAFFNASVQGTARMGQVLFDTKNGDGLRLTTAGRTIIGGGIMLGAIQAALLAAAGFDDDEPQQFVRERNLIIPLSPVTGDKKYITIPMPLGWHVFPNIGRVATEFALGGFKDPGKRAIELMAVFADSFNPIGNAGVSFQTIAPTVADPAVAILENRDWNRKPIAKVSLDPVVPGHQLARDVASIPARVIAEGINYITGGTEFTRGAISPTPDQIDYLWGQLTGGVGRELTKVMQTGQATYTGEDLPPHKIPLVGRFYGDAEGPSSQASRFYEAVNRIRAHKAELDGLRTKEDGSERIAAYLKDNPEAGLTFAAENASKIVRDLRNRKRKFMEAGASRADIKAIEDQITETMRIFNERMLKPVKQPTKQAAMAE